jgi:hypothetical protein
MFLCSVSRSKFQAIFGSDMRPLFAILGLLDSTTRGQAAGDHMKSASLISMVFAVSTLLFAHNTKAASTVTAFDGTWSVTGNGHEYINPDGSVTLTWVIHFPAKVKNGVLHGEWETRGAPGLLVLNGKMAANGTVILRTTGLTGNPAYTIGHAHSSIPYEYDVIAHFDDRHGTGKSVNVPPASPVSISLPSLKIRSRMSIDG